jgi:ABC-type Fe3+-hydroxamate transport system substrate-binding protein
MLRDTRNIAVLVGREEVAEQQIQRLHDRLAAYVERAPKDKSVMFVVLTADGREVWLYETGGFAVCGIVAQVADCLGLDEGYVATVETMLNLDPDVIFYRSTVGGDYYANIDEVRALFEDNPLWQELTAYQTQQIYPIPYDRSLPGYAPKAALLALDYFMPLLYPDVFPAPLTDEEVQEIMGE